MVNMDNKNRIVNAPDKIYIHEVSALELALPRKDYHLEYICKDALLEWAKNELENAKNTDFDEFGRGEVITLKRIIDKINSM